MLWRHYDQAALDAQLNLRAKWPHHPEVFARWAALSAEARTRLQGQRDLAYGSSAKETLDLFHPGGGPVPLVVFIHGGYWQALDKGDFSYLAPPFLAAGVAFASINYDLAPQVSMTTIARQVTAALDWLYAQAGPLALDPTRVVVAGHSAGGHLALLTALTAGRGLKGVVSVSGVYDLTPISLSYQQAVLKITPEEAWVLSPARLAPSHFAPLLLAVGGAETQEFVQQQADLAALWQRQSLPLQAITLAGLDHFAAVDPFAEPSHPLHQKTLDFLRGA